MHISLIDEKIIRFRRAVSIEMGFNPFLLIGLIQIALVFNPFLKLKKG
jgi:hypothetical protein